MIDPILSSALEHAAQQQLVVEVPHYDFHAQRKGIGIKLQADPARTIRISPGPAGYSHQLTFTSYNEQNRDAIFMISP